MILVFIKRKENGAISEISIIEDLFRSKQKYP